MGEIGKREPVAQCSRKKPAGYGGKALVAMNGLPNKQSPVIIQLAVELDQDQRLLTFSSSAQDKFQ